MFSFTKPLENLIGAAYLSGALEGLKKANELDPTNIQEFFDDARHVRRVLLNRAESDGYKKPVQHIEEAKLKAKEVLNSKNTNRTPRNTNTIPNSPTVPTTPPTTPTTPTTPASETQTHEIMPLEKTPNSKPVNQKLLPPPVLQLGGKRHRKNKRKTVKRKH